MEWRIRLLFLLCFLLLAEGLSHMMAGGLGPCLIKPASGQQAANDNQHQDCPTFLAGTLIVFERGYNWIKHDDNDKAVVGAFTVVLALSTIGLWLATNKLWAAGEKQSREMRRSIEAFEVMSREAKKANDISKKSVLFANRAWVGTVGAEAKKFEIGKPIDVLVRIKNTGHSPALQVRGGFNAALLKKGEAPDDPATTKIDTAATVLMPNGSFHYYPFSDYAPLTQQELESILAGEIVIWIVGRVEYNDANAQPHYSIYKLHYDIKDKGFSTAIDGTDAT
jgi:hypothetical protein